MDGHAYSPVPAIEQRVPATVVIIFRSGAVHTHLPIDIGTVIPLKEERHTRSQSLCTMDCPHIVAFPPGLHELVETGCLRLLSSPNSIELTLFLHIAFVVVIIYFHTHGKRTLGYTISFPVDQFHPGRMIKRHWKISIVGGVVSAHQDAPHCRLSISVTKEIGYRRIDRLHRLIIPPGREDQILVETFKGSAAINLKADDPATRLLVEEEHLLVRLNGKRLFLHKEPAGETRGVVVHRGRDVTPQVAHLCKQCSVGRGELSCP